MLITGIKKEATASYIILLLQPYNLLFAAA